MATSKAPKAALEAPTKARKLVAPITPQPPRISRLKSGMQGSITGAAAEEIQQLLETNNNESATTLIQKRLLQTLTDLVPYAEENVRNSEGSRGVYQINSLITSIRELLIDMQSTRDKGVIGEMMVEKVIRPAFLDIGMILVQEDARIDKEIQALVGPKTYLRIKQYREESLTRTAEHIQRKYAEAKEQSIAFLQQ